jgi:hypothetical protein
MQLPQSKKIQFSHNLFLLFLIHCHALFRFNSTALKFCDRRNMHLIFRRPIQIRVGQISYTKLLDPFPGFNATSQQHKRKRAKNCNFLHVFLPYHHETNNLGSSDNPVVAGSSHHKFFLVTENPLGGVDQICMRISMPFNIYMVILTVG